VPKDPALEILQPGDARVTVLTNGTEATAISTGELAQIVDGQPKAGFWIRIGDEYPNAAVTLEQQYQP
jgi:hypothetical protein